MMFPSYWTITANLTLQKLCGKVTFTTSFS